MNGRDLRQLVGESTRSLRTRNVVVHASEPAVTTANAEWTRRFALAPDEHALARHARIGCGSFASHTYPRATDPVVCLGADLITWLFLFDDRFGEATGTESSADPGGFESYERALRTLDVPANATAFHRALVDIAERGTALANAAWLSRFADSIASYFRGCLMEGPYRNGRGTPTLAQYRDLRTLSVGAYPVFDLIELASGQILSDHEVNCPEVVGGRELAACLCAWVNDVYSYPKETVARDPLNLVSVIMNERGLGSEEALSSAVALFNAELEHFCELVHGAKSRSTTSIAAYLNGLEDWVFGNRTWTVTSGRYE